MKVLNLGAGKLKPIFSEKMLEENNLIVNLDSGYYKSVDPVELEYLIIQWNNETNYESKTYYCNENAFTFMERTHNIFDRIVAYRFLEHIAWGQVLYFIYLLSTVVRKEGIVDIIVPNFETLSKMLLKEDINSKEFEANNIIITTELLNDPEMPHASIWTPQRMIYYFELEKRFKVKTIVNNFEFDGRDIYLRSIINRI